MTSDSNISSRPGSAEGFGQPGAEAPRGPGYAMNMMEQIKAYGLDFEQYTRELDAQKQCYEAESDPDEPRQTFEQKFAEMEVVLEDLKSKFSALRTSLFDSRDPKGSTAALKADWRAATPTDTNNKAQSLQHAVTLDEPEKTVPRLRNTSEGIIPSNTQNSSWPLDLDEYKRYGRQLIMPEIGLSGQLRLKNAKVLIIGAGGLGCPAAAYIAGAGAGHITIVDGDMVEESNLHRQVMHTTLWLGKSKAKSLVNALALINPKPTYEACTEYFEPAHAEHFKGFSIILDCTDRPSSRYLISDTAAVLGVPLVSASALRTEGQIMVLNDPPAPAGDSTGGPCYRCIFPKPPPAESVQSCGEGGIFGPVVGIMGVLQALEAIRVLTRAAEKLPDPPSMLMLSAYGMPIFRAMKVRGRHPACKACSATATINLETLKQGSVDYVAFCGGSAQSNILAPEERVLAKEYNRIRARENQILLDVRERVQFELCSLSGSINIPYSIAQRWRHKDEVFDALNLDFNNQPSIYVVCRLGNDSQHVVKKLREMGVAKEAGGKILDIEGGWRAWRRDVDQDWPDY